MTDQKDFHMIGLVTFKATSVEVVPVTDEAREIFQCWFGEGVVSVNVPKSQAYRILDQIDAVGLSWESRPAKV